MRSSSRAIRLESSRGQAQRLDSEHFRFAPRTCRPLCGRLKLRKTEHGPIGGSDSASGRKSPMLDLKRREFIALVGAGGLLLAVKVKRAWGQQPAMPVIGFLGG